MMDRDGSLVRFRLVFADRHLLNKSQRSQGLRRCWFRLKPGLATVGKLASHLRKSFGIHDRIVLSVDDFVLPAFESTRIITNKDIIKVNKKEIRQNDVSRPYGRQYLLQDSQISIPRNMASGNELLVDRKSKNISEGNESSHKEVLLSCRSNTVLVGPTSGFVSAKRNREHSNKLPNAKRKKLENKISEIPVANSISDIEGQCMESNTGYEFEPNVVSGEAKALMQCNDVYQKRPRFQMVHHKSDGEEDVPVVVRRGHIRFEPQGNLVQKTVGTQQPLPFDAVNWKSRQSWKKDRTFWERSNCDRHFKRNWVPAINGSWSSRKLNATCSANLKSHNSEEAANQEEATRKDNWEEAVAKGNWTEPNTPSQEKNCGWTQWNPNKSTTQTSTWSCKQYNRPFLAGRTNGRTNCPQNKNKSYSCTSWSKPKMGFKW